ncbi:MAG TPA: hypothetical protein VMT16_04105 [Thermoanaerobaculia bacterium]|nr:hypothetical protein [Thermoanaerobaculia bacterium]
MNSRFDDSNSDRSRSGPGPSRPLLELQIHSPDIRKKVRYLFLSKNELSFWSAVLSLYLVAVVLAAAVTPGVVADLWHRREHRSLQAERGRLDERLGSQIGTLEALASEGDELRLVIDKVFLLYGLSSEVTGGQGSFPFLGRTEGPEGEEVPLARAQRLESAVRERLSVAGVFLQEIQAFEGARRDLVRLTPSRSPLRRADFVLTSPFGDRRTSSTTAGGTRRESWSTAASPRPQPTSSPCPPSRSLATRRARFAPDVRTTRSRNRARARLLDARLGDHPESKSLSLRNRCGRIGAGPARVLV